VEFDPVVQVSLFAGRGFEHIGTQMMPGKFKKGKIYLHIGTHKTGSTSVQEFLNNNRDSLRERGIEFYKGSIIESNHIELYLSAIDETKDSLARRSLKIGSLSELRTRTKREIGDFLDRSSARSVIFSTEGLSLLRSQDELNLLHDILNAGVNEVGVICVLRKKEEFLSAYRKQILKAPGRRPSDNPKSCLYVEKDSWLTDYESLLEGYGGLFGRKNLHVIDYDAELVAHGDVLPAILKEMGIPNDLIPVPGSVKRSNRSSLQNRMKQTAHKILSWLKIR
jgi:hypothetical protein